MKVCSRCKKRKPESEFHKNRRTLDGLSHYCKECVREYGHKWHKANPKKVKEISRKYRKANFGKVKKRERKWRKVHLEEVNERSRRWNKANPEKVKEMSRKAYLKRVFDLTPEEYNRMFEAQGGVCAICGEPERVDRLKYLSIDHNHITGKVRGLLCSRCNFVVGVTGENIVILQRTIDYLRKHAQKKKKARK